MCLPSSWDTMTRQERLAGADAMRAHHKALYRELDDAAWALRRASLTTEEACGARYDAAKKAIGAHTKEHNEAVRQRREREAQKGRVK